MSSVQASAVKAGVLMLGAIAALLAVVTLAGGKPGPFAPAADLEARFHRVSGLQAGAPVALLGMTIGTVERISLAGGPAGDYVAVRMRVDKAAARRLHADSQAQIETMGLLGDKFVELTPGTSQAGPVRAGAALYARDPVDYEALVGRQNTQDFLANAYAIADSMRALLEQLQNGHGLLSELIRGDGNGAEPSLRDIKQSLQHIDRASAALERLIKQVADEHSPAGALLSDKNDGRKMVSDLGASIASLRTSAARLDRLSARLEHAHGLIPRLVEDPQLADRLIGELDQTSRRLERILYKIDTGQGTLGKMVNDPTLYDRADSLLSGGGWGLSLMRSLYGISHPFSPPLSQTQSASSGACACSRARGSNNPAASGRDPAPNFSAASPPAATP